MFKQLSPEEILEQNPRVDKEELEELRQTVRKMRADRIGGMRRTGHKFPSPYTRPGVRRDTGKPPQPRTVQATRRR